ncbi:tripartite tricarboxylate transporter substrate-binding protein [Rhodoferax sp.]|uniref:Bug family tripartite tricarboxylate transporter substrate binding protein n=1 Tax=Rhodoferax sp. TaxID=50421 RepID=UPI00260D67FB|nr:tripartite tricarboxylate transporter substrate-binding protein [Rhodoferax sp.]MDD2918150.1 tripartite tricarboxylate transporter substrate-binding protein [Rhodoferax sp.]
MPAWRSKPLRIIVGFPGGSSPDLTARTLAEPLVKALGQPVIVENKVGAGGHIAADHVATAMIGGQLQLSMLPPALAMAQVRGDKLRAIGVDSSGRSALVPELPSMAEVGVPDFNLKIWNAVAAPKSMPPALVAKLAVPVRDMARSPEVRQKLNAQGWPKAFRPIPCCLVASSRRLAKRTSNSSRRAGSGPWLRYFSHCGGTRLPPPHRICP